MMIDKIIIKNKKGETLELTKEEFEELKLELSPVEYVHTYPYTVPYPLYPYSNGTGNPVLELTKITC